VAIPFNKVVYDEKWAFTITSKTRTLGVVKVLSIVDYFRVF